MERDISKCWVIVQGTFFFFFSFFDKYVSHLTRILYNGEFITENMKFHFTIFSTVNVFILVTLLSSVVGEALYTVIYLL